MGCGQSQPRIKKLRDCVRVGIVQGKISQCQSQSASSHYKSKSNSTNSSGSSFNYGNQLMTSFDDFQAIKERGQSFNKINAIKVSFTSSTILNLEVAYELDDGSIITGESSRVYSGTTNNSPYKEEKKGKSKKNTSINSQMRVQQADKVMLNDNLVQKIYSEVFEILSDDYLLEISGSANNSHVEQIKFKTYRGIEGVFGWRKNGSSFCFKEEGQTFGPLSGAFKQNLDLKALIMFEFRLVDTPSEFLISFHNKKKDVSYQQSPHFKQKSNFNKTNNKSNSVE